MVEFDLLTFSRFPLWKTEQKFFLSKYRTHDFRTKLVSMRGRPLDHSGDEVHQGVHELFVRLETRVDYVYERRK